MIHVTDNVLLVMPTSNAQLREGGGGFLFLATELERANKKWMSGGKECMYINSRFKTIFPLLLT
jgi:hypothetical protein